MLTLSVYMEGKIKTGMEEMTKDVVRRAIEECGRRYGFDGEEACRELGVCMVSKEKKERKLSLSSSSSLSSVSSSFPLPYNGEMKSDCCHGLKQTMACTRNANKC